MSWITCFFHKGSWQQGKMRSSCVPQPGGNLSANSVMANES